MLASSVHPRAAALIVFVATLLGSVSRCFAVQQSSVISPLTGAGSSGSSESLFQSQLARTWVTERVPNPRVTTILPSMRLRGGFMGCCGAPSAATESEDSDDGEVKPRVVFVLGGPGSGKGTHCGKLCEEYEGILHLSAGDLLREEKLSGSKDGAMIEQYMKDGKIIPVQLTARLLLRAIDSHRDRFKLFLVDGFPRDMKNLAGWRSIVGNKAEVAFMLFLECDKQVMLDRLLQRGKTSGRIDDNRASILKRFEVYESSTKQVVGDFQRRDKLQRVKSEGSKAEVFDRVRQVFAPLRQEMGLRRRWRSERLVLSGLGAAALLGAAAVALK